MSAEHHRQFYIGGRWVTPSSDETIDVINPANESVVAQIAAGQVEDVDNAVAAAKAAFARFRKTSPMERRELLEAVLAEYLKRWDDLTLATTQAMGAPLSLSRQWQTGLGEKHIQSAIRALTNFRFEYEQDHLLLRHEPIGVCGLITPWNWPMNQITVKVAPALAAGCTVVLKPSEESPLDAIVFAEIMDAAGVPDGVFNLVNGYGPVVGEAMSAHPDIAMMSFTGSTRGGIAVAKRAAESVKRVSQELGGKSANILLDDCDIGEAVTAGLLWVMENSGQSCNAPTRLLVPNSRMDDALAAAKDALDKVTVDDPMKEGDHIGPVVNRKQFDQIRELIQTGIDEGATLLGGGTDRPAGLDTGFYIKPTVFTNVDNSMTIAREEIFGPVLTIIGYDTIEDAIAIANDSPYGLAAYVSSADKSRAIDVARQLEAGQVAINYVGGDTETPFGGYKQSGNGREKGRWGLEEFLELKAITGAVEAV